MILLLHITHPFRVDEQKKFRHLTFIYQKQKTNNSGGDNKVFDNDLHRTSVFSIVIKHIESIGDSTIPIPESSN